MKLSDELLQLERTDDRRVGLVGWGSCWAELRTLLLEHWTRLGRCGGGDVCGVGRVRVGSGSLELEQGFLESGNPGAVAIQKVRSVWRELLHWRGRGPGAVGEKWRGAGP